MGDPWLPGASEGKMIGVRDAAVFRDPLPGAQMPPQIGIDRVTRRHRQQAEQEYAAENRTSTAAGNSELDHRTGL